MTALFRLISDTSSSLSLSIDTHSIERIERIIKDTAKEFFFRRQIDHFIAFVSHPIDPHDLVYMRLEEQFARIIGSDSASMVEGLHHQIGLSIAAQGLQPDLRGILQVLDYGHLMSFIQIFD